MKKFLFLVPALILSGCAFNAKDEVPGTQWNKAIMSISTNGTASCEIDRYNSKKDVEFSYNPITHSMSLGSVMNPSNTMAASVAIQAQGQANTSQITASGAAASQIISALGSAAAAADAAGVKAP